MENLNWYNRKEDIEKKLDTLENFYEVIEARRIAYQRKENLEEFYVFKAAFHLDQFGQCWKVFNPNLKTIINQVIVTEEELWTIIRNYDHSRNALTRDEINKDFEQARTSGRPFPTEFAMTFEYPPFPGVLCPECGKGWDISNLTDYIKMDGKNIDKTIQYFHKQCLHKSLDRTQQEQFTEVFQKVGFSEIVIKPIKNEYEGCQDPNCTKCASWFLIETGYGIFKVGWRKRVINITWPKEKNFLSLFIGENVTKSESFIHAHGWEKLEEYLTKIQQELFK